MSLFIILHWQTPLADSDKKNCFWRGKMSLLSDLINLNLSEITEKFIAEYIWLVFFKIFFLLFHPSYDLYDLYTSWVGGFCLLFMESHLVDNHVCYADRWSFHVLALCNFYVISKMFGTLLNGFSQILSLFSLCYFVLGDSKQNNFSELPFFVMYLQHVVHEMFNFSGLLILSEQFLNFILFSICMF